MKRMCSMMLIALPVFLLNSCDLLTNDGSPDELTPGGRGYFYMLDRESVSLLMLEPNLTEMKRWNLFDILADSSVQGLAFDGRYVWIASAGSLDRILQIDPSGDSLVVMKSFDAPPTRQGTIRDLAWDGTFLWAVNSGSTTYATPATLYKLNPNDGSILGQFILPSPEPRGMTYVGSNSDTYGRGAEVGLYYTDVSTKMIYKFRTERSQFDTAFSSPVPPRGVYNIYPVGITHDGTNFWLINSSGPSDHLYRLDYSGKANQRFDLPYAYPGSIVWTAADLRIPEPLTLLGCSPTSAARGTSVVVDVYGTGFKAGVNLAVAFGDSVTSTSVQYLNSGLLRTAITISSGAVLGKRRVSVTLPDGRSASDTLFEVTVAPPSPGYLWIADQYASNPLISKIRLSDTTVVQQWDPRMISSGSAQGLTYDGTNIWYCASGTDRRIYKLNTSGAVLSPISAISAPVAGGTLRGISSNSGYIWLAVSGFTTGLGKIFKLDVSTGAALDSVLTPGIEPRAVVFANGKMYTNDTSIDSVFVYDGTAKTWSGVFATPTPSGGTTANRFATGMTFDGTYFWIANSTNNFDHLYKMTQTGVVLQSFQAPQIGNAQITGIVYTPN